MKVLLLSFQYPPLPGGGAAACREIARGLAALGHEPFVVTAGCAGLVPETEAGGAHVVEVPVAKAESGRRRIAGLVRYVAGAFREGGRLHGAISIDATLAVHAVPAGIAAWALRARFGIRYVLRIGAADVPGYGPEGRTFGERALGAMAGPAWRKASAVVARSDLMRGTAARLRPAVPIEVIPNGIDLDEFRPGEARPIEPPAPALPLKILCVAPLAHGKGLPHLIEAMRLLVRDRQDVEADIVGTGPEEGRLREAIELAGLEPRVRLAGLVPRPRLPGWYRLADAFVLPSLAESFSTALLEALASGLPIVATDVGGTRTLVREGWNGFIAPPGDAEALARAIARLAELPSGQRRGMAERSREMARAYGWGAIVERYLALLRSR